MRSQTIFIRKCYSSQLRHRMRIFAGTFRAEQKGDGENRARREATRKSAHPVSCYSYGVGRPALRRPATTDRPGRLYRLVAGFLRANPNRFGHRRKKDLSIADLA